LTRLATSAYTQPRMILGTLSGWDNFLLILTKPDNIPIVMMMGAVGYFTWLSLREGFKNDRLIKEGRRDEVLRQMQD
jgi:hypothetical protein